MNFPALFLLLINIRRSAPRNSNMRLLRDFPDESLGILREDAERRQFADDHARLIRYLYGENTTDHGGAIQALFRQLARPEEETEGRSPKKQRELLLNAIEVETQEVETEYALFRRDHIELTAWAKGAMLAPDEGSRWIIQEAATLDRAIDRKIKLLMELRKDLRQQLKWEREEAEANAGADSQEPVASSQEPVGASLPRQGEEENKDPQPEGASSPRQSEELNQAPQSSAAGGGRVGGAAESTEASADMAPADAEAAHDDHL